MSNKHFRADHVGSLLRPAGLKEARISYDKKQLSDEQMRAAEDGFIREAIALQESVGLQAITDGEFRRMIYFGHFPAAVSGFTMMASEITFDETGKRIRYMSPAITGKLRRERGIATQEFKFMRANTGRTPKITLPSPADQHAFRYREGISDQVYPFLTEFFADVAAIYQEELAELAALGSTYVQLDDTTFTLLCDAKWRQRFEGRGYDAAEMVTRYIQMINEAIAHRPDEMTIAMHLCRGNNQGEWLFSGGYDAVAEELFTTLDIDAFFLEYDSERAGTFAALRFMPRDKFVLLGLITSKSGQLEAPEHLLQRIEQASHYFPHEQMGISPQCGFASTAPGNPLTPEEQRRKLELVVEVAEKAWGDW